MGHTISTYHDIQMKGVEFLCQIYITSGISIKKRVRTSKIEMLKEIIRAWGLNPEEILTRQALTQPYTTRVASVEWEREQMRELSKALREMLRKELLPTK